MMTSKEIGSFKMNNNLIFTLLPLNGAGWGEQKSKQRKLHKLMKLYDSCNLTKTPRLQCHNTSKGYNKQV